MQSKKLERIQAEYGIPQERVMTVSNLNAYISNKFWDDKKLHLLYLIGEVSNLYRSSSNHLFFDLKDEKAKISCVIFDCEKQQLDLLKDGKEVLIRGRVDFYERDGKPSIKPDKIYPIGEGLLYHKLKKLMNKLREEGLFREEHKKPIPSLPEKIGIVTSQGGDALQDMVKSIHSRHSNVDIYVYNATVQGDSAAQELCEGIQFFENEYPVDVILLGRGGGSMEDLMAFNDELLARVIYDAEIPIIVGVGHREDETIAGYTADYRAITPTEAGKLAVADKQNMLLQLDKLQRQLQSSYQRFLKMKRQEEAIERGRQLETKYKIVILALIIFVIALLVVMVVL